jgi:membrane protein implicated in regulation of membrane protease activity/DNA-binding CsgD family transcriptional regulator
MPIFQAWAQLPMGSYVSAKQWQHVDLRAWPSGEKTYDMIWLVWIAIALIALAGEAFTTALVLASFALAALIVSPLSLVVPWPAQVVVFAAMSLILIIAVRPLALRFLPIDLGSTEPSAGGIAGRQAVTTERIDGRGGQIRIGQGEFWSARPADVSAIPPGSTVEVVRVEGLTAVVRPVGVPGRSTSPVGRNSFGLSSREREVLQLVADGFTNAEIADRLVLSTRTIDHHVSHILEKMNASSRVDAVRMGMENGLIRTDGL